MPHLPSFEWCAQGTRHARREAARRRYVFSDIRVCVYVCVGDLLGVLDLLDDPKINNFRLFSGPVTSEQAKGKPLDGRSYIFSFGALLYEMLSARKAFGGECAISIMTLVLHKDPPPMPEAPPEVVIKFGRIVRRLSNQQAGAAFCEQLD